MQSNRWVVKLNCAIVWMSSAPRSHLLQRTVCRRWLFSELYFRSEPASHRQPGTRLRRLIVGRRYLPAGGRAAHAVLRRLE